MMCQGTCFGKQKFPMVFQNGTETTKDLVISISHYSNQYDYFVFGGSFGDNAIIGSYQASYLIGGLQWMKELKFSSPIERSIVGSVFIYETKNITFASIWSFKLNGAPYSQVLAKIDNKNGTILAQSQLLSSNFVSQKYQQLVAITQNDIFMSTGQSGPYFFLASIDSELQTVQSMLSITSYQSSYFRALHFDQENQYGYMAYDVMNDQASAVYLGFSFYYQNQWKSHAMHKLDQSLLENQFVTVKQIANYKTYVFACISNSDIVTSNSPFNYVGYAMMDSKNNYFSYVYVGQMIASTHNY
eukprot:403353720